MFLASAPLARDKSMYQKSIDTINGKGNPFYIVHLRFWVYALPRPGVEKGMTAGRYAETAIMIR